MHPKVWIPVNSPSVLEELNAEAHKLASDMLGGGVMENDFKALDLMCRGMFSLGVEDEAFREHV